MTKTNRSRCAPIIRAKLSVESLEERQLLAGNILFSARTGIVTIHGTELRDEARVAIVDNRLEVTLTTDGETITNAFKASQVKKINFYGGDGDDRFINDSSKPSIAWGESGNDYLEGGPANDRLFGGEGDDILVGFGGDDRLFGEDGNDYLFGLAGMDRLEGGPGDDHLFGGLAADKLIDSWGQNVLDQHGDGPIADITDAHSSQKLKDYLGGRGGDGTLSGLEREIIDLVNVERESRGLAPLRINNKLVQAAQHHAGNMAAQRRMAHSLSGADLPDPEDRLDHYNYQWWTWGENVAYGYAGAQTVMNAWMNSSGHRENILNGNFTEIGVGVRLSSNGVPYYCQVFGRPA